MNDLKIKFISEVELEIREQAERDFKSLVKAKILAIAGIQNQISQLSLKLAEAKKELSSLEFSLPEKIL